MARVGFMVRVAGRESPLRVNRSPSEKPWHQSQRAGLKVYASQPKNPVQGVSGTGDLRPHFVIAQSGQKDTPEGERIMGEPEARFVKFVKGHYWVTLTKAAEHPYKVFRDRHEAKVWLVEHGLGRTLAESCLLEAQAGVSPRVLLSLD
jgi:hypothetical protein